MVIRRGQGNVVTVKRSRTKTVVVQLNTSRGDCEDIAVAPKPTPPPPREPTYVMQWLREMKVIARMCKHSPMFHKIDIIREV